MNFKEQESAFVSQTNAFINLYHQFKDQQPPVEQGNDIARIVTGRLYEQLETIVQDDDFINLKHRLSRKQRYLINRLDLTKTFSGIDGVNVPKQKLFDSLPPLFNIKEIPSRTVWHGDECNFLIDWKEHPDATLTLTAEPQPAGALTLEQISPDNLTWSFHYSPDKQDKFPFNITISAKTTAGESESCAFEMTPMQKLPAEQIVFSTESHTGTAMPLAIEKPECTESESIRHYDKEKAETWFNYKTPESGAILKLKHIRIVGETVVFDKNNDEYGIYATYHENNAIEKMEIIAEKLVIRSPLRLYQTDVTIYAKEVRFETPEARIKTTPLEKTGRPEVSKNGAPGLNAGNITLHIKTLFTATDGQVCFDLTGGKGQDGGNGQDGVHNTTHLKGEQTIEMPIFISPPECSRYTSHTVEDGYKVIYVEEYLLGTHIPGNDLWPENKLVKPEDLNGIASQPPGNPGEPGNGGTITGNIDVLSWISCGGGICGNLPDKAVYSAGQPGTPSKWVKLFYFDVIFDLSFKEMERGEAKPAGKDYVCADFAPKKKTGAAGTWKKQWDPLSWLHPELVKLVFTRTRENYLNNRITDAAACFQEYATLLEAYKKSEAWRQLSAQDSLDLSALHNEMQRLLHQIGNNLDYFGHPAGWTPLLSFEVTRTAFENEIKTAAGILFYTYLIKNRETDNTRKLEALKSLQEQLLKDNDAYLASYEKEVTKLSDLEMTARNLQKQTELLQKELKGLEENFEQQAQLTADVIATLRLSGKIAGTIVSMIPVGQPATGIVGSSISLLSDFDPKKPWDTIIGGADIAGKYVKSEFSSKAKDTENVIKEANSKTRASKSQKELIETCTALSESGSALSDGLKEIKEFTSSNSDSEENIAAQVEYLKTRSPEYQEILEQIEQLLKEKQEFARQLANSMEKATSLYNDFLNNVQALEATYTESREAWRKLDKRATDYLAQLERRAYDRLLEYHYYFAKAFEYRLLEPYTNHLDAEQVIKRLEEHAKVHKIEELDAETFKTTYTIVYADYLSEIANKIFTDYNQKPKEQSCRFEYQLSADELQRLNEGKSIEVDFSRYLPNEENLRIVDVGILMLDKERRKGDIQTIAAGSEYQNNAYIDLRIEHPGVSKLKSGINIYKFQHPNLDAVNPLTWQARYTPQSDIVDPHSPSTAGESLLRSLLKGEAGSDMMLYSRPSVWTRLRVAKSGFPDDGNGVKLTHCTLELVYDYFVSQRGQSTDIEVLVTKLQTGEDGAIEAVETDMTPYFIVDKVDRNQRQDARGSFLRIFKTEIDTTVKISAQPKYGAWVFNKWTDSSGKELPEAHGETIEIDLKGSKAICAQYSSKKQKMTDAANAAYALRHAIKESVP